MTCNQDQHFAEWTCIYGHVFHSMRILNDIHLIMVNADIKLLKISLNMSAAHADDKPTWWKWSWPSTGAQCVWCLLYTYSLPPVNLQYRDKISKHAHSVESHHTLQCYYLLLLSWAGEAAAKTIVSPSHGSHVQHSRHALVVCSTPGQGGCGDPVPVVAAGPAGRSDRQQPDRQPAAEEGQTCAQRQQDSWPRYRESSRDWTSDEIFQSLWWDFKFSLCNIIADRVGR